ncbi:MAG: phosphatase PAP2 family protein [Deltaproteobacteria bacterium]|nr:phosphatase PAP2 family protein [Deltaproteobacteria bacterium]
METWNELDTKLFEFLNSADLGPVLTDMMVFLSNRELWFIIVGGYFLVGFFRERMAFLKIAVALTSVVIVTDWVSYRLIKQSVGRMRPCHVLENVRLVAEGCGGDLSFPSNHAANGMAFIVLLWLIKRKVVYLWLLFPVLAVGYSRIVLGVHYPFDVLGGFVVGAFFAGLFYGVGKAIKVFH